MDANGNITGFSIWQPTIRGVKVADRVLGGELGSVNIMAQGLADRDTYLYNQIQSIKDQGGASYTFFLTLAHPTAGITDQVNQVRPNATTVQSNVLAILGGNTLASGSLVLLQWQYYNSYWSGNHGAHRYTWMASWYSVDGDLSANTTETVLTFIHSYAVTV